jgi:uncharacterized protein YbcV (DUF1398 family)
MADVMIQALENAEISVEDSERSADFILNKFDKVTSKDQFISFLEELSNAWPAYKNLYLKEKGGETVVEDQTKIAEIQNNLESLSENQTN